MLKMSANYKILITGTAGFIGFYLAKHLLANDYTIVGLDNINNYYDIRLKFARLAETGIDQNEVEYGKLLQSNTFEKYRFVMANLEDRETLYNLFISEKFDIVVNLAAQAGVRYSIENPHAYIDSNIVGFMNILECCRHNKIKHLVYASSSSVYGNGNKVPFSENDCVDFPVSLYAATKKANELMAHTYSHLYHLPTTGLRFFTVYGEWGRPDMAPMLFAQSIIDEKPIKVFNHGDLSRDFTYIEDVIEGIARITNHIPNIFTIPAYYQLFNVGNSVPVSLMDFINTMENEFGKQAILEMYPMQQGDVKMTYADITHLEKAVAYKPKTSLKEGLNKFAKWFNTYMKTI
jgi:UDP-glucuronate 4-epimerase